MTVDQNQHVLPDGTVITLGRVSPMLYQDINKSVPRPRPPVNIVDMGAGPVEELNYQHPDYLRALTERELDVNALFMDVVLDIGATLPFSNDELRSRLETYAAHVYRATSGTVDINIDRAPVATYISRISGAEFDEVTKIVQKILGKSQPTEEAIAEAVNTF